MQRRWRRTGQSVMAAAGLAWRHGRRLRRVSDPRGEMGETLHFGLGQIVRSKLSQARP